MSSGSWPNFDAWLQTAWGAGAEYWSSGLAYLFSGATNLVFGVNPPYYLDDFLSFYPKFFGAPSYIANCSTTLGSNIVQVSSVNGLMPGQFVQIPNLPKGTFISALGSGQITVNQNATATGTNLVVLAYTSTPIPVGVIMAYLCLANASLVQARWQEQWWIAMGWFIAHYCTLYAQTDATELTIAMQTIIHGETPAGTAPSITYTLSTQPPGNVLQSLTKNGMFLTPGVDYSLNGVTITLTVETIITDALYATWPIQQEVVTANVVGPAQIAAQGIANGILTSKSVGDVSGSYSVLQSLEQFGQWNLTKYGQQLATMAKVVGSGPMVIW